MGRTSRLVPSRMKQRPAQPPVARRPFVFIPKRIGGDATSREKKGSDVDTMSTSNHILPSRSLIAFSA